MLFDQLLVANDMQGEKGNAKLLGNPQAPFSMGARSAIDQNDQHDGENNGNALSEHRHLRIERNRAMLFSLLS